MKAKELIEFLSAVSPEAEVIIAKDSEGNAYSPLSAVDVDAVFVPEIIWYGDACDGNGQEIEVYYMEWSAYDACMDEDEWVEIQFKQRCVVLHPAN